MGEWGEFPKLMPAYHYITGDTTNGFVCIQYVEELQFTSAGRPGWLDFIMKTIVPKKSIILDVFGESGIRIVHYLTHACYATVDIVTFPLLYLTLFVHQKC